MVLGGSHPRVVAWLVVISVILSIGMATSCSTTDRSSPQAGRSSPPVVRPATFREVADPASAPGDADAPSAGVQKGKELYDTLGCAGCHKVNGQGGTAGPDLSNEANQGRSRSWLATQIRNPKIHSPQTIMPANGSLSDQQVDNLVDYLLSLSSERAGAAAASIAPGRPTASAVSSAIVTGGTQWSQRCGQCHNLRPPSEYDDAQWTAAVHHMRVRVPLTGQEQRDILAFLQASN
ncbi:MAG: cytochrome c [Planctomycetes bacterium]|nr:cytochrome c [Planctomycetota bacterium]